VHRSQRREAEKRSSIVRQPRGGDSRHIPIWGKYDENNASRAREEVEMLFFFPRARNHNTRVSQSRAPRHVQLQQASPSPSARGSGRLRRLGKSAVVTCKQWPLRHKGP
jgi:hypothetical protein